MFAYPDINTRGTGRILDRFCKPSTSSRVCITVSNSPNPSRVYIRLLKHGKRFLLLKCHFKCDKRSCQQYDFQGFVPLFPSRIALCSHVPTCFPYLFPFNKFTYHLSPQSTTTVITIHDIITNHDRTGDLKVTRPSFLGGVPSYFEAFWYPHLDFYRKSNT